MSKVIKVLHKTFLPGVGFTTAGAAKQGKTSVKGVIEVTNYARGGETLTAADLGLTTLDHLQIAHREPLGSADPGGARREVHYSYSAQQFYCIRETTGGEFLEEAATVDPVLTFEAFGDSVHDVELV